MHRPVVAPPPHAVAVALSGSGACLASTHSRLLVPLVAAAVIVRWHNHPPHCPPTESRPTPLRPSRSDLPPHRFPFHVPTRGAARARPFSTFADSQQASSQPLTAQQLRARQIDNYVRDWKRQLAESHGIHPVLTNPDVYVAQTAHQANLLAALFKLDPVVGLDAKLVPMHYIDPDSVRHLRHGATSDLHSHDPDPIAVREDEASVTTDSSVSEPCLDLHTSSPVDPAISIPPRPPPPSNIPFFEAYTRAIPHDLVSTLPHSALHAASPTVLLTPYRGLPTPSNPRPISLLQLASHHTCVLFQLRRMVLAPPHKFPSGLRSLLASRAIAKYATHSTRLRLQLSHSYQVMPAYTVDIRDACQRAGVSGSPHLGFTHPAAAATNARDGSTVTWTELDMLFRPGLRWTLRTPPYSDYGQWDWDAPVLDTLWVRQAADEAFLRYLVGLKLTQTGLAPVPVAEGQRVAGGQTKEQQEQEVLRLMQKYIRKRSALAVGRSVPTKRVVEYVMAQYGPWRVEFGEKERRQRVVQVLIEAAKAGTLVMVTGGWWNDPEVDCELVDPRVIGQRNYYVRLPKLTRSLATVLPHDPRITPPMADRLDRTPSDTLDLGPAITDNDMYAAGPFKAEFVRRLGRHIAHHVRLVHPNLLAATTDTSAREFKATTTQTAVLKFIRNAPSLLRLPLSLPARHALAEHVYRHLVLDGHVLFDPCDREAVAWAPGTPGQVSTAALVKNYGACPDVLLFKCMDAVRMTSAVRASRAMTREALVNVMVSGTQLLAWVRAIVAGGNSKKACSVLEVDAEGAKILAAWVIAGWANRGLVAEFKDQVTGTDYVMLRGFGAAVQSAPVTEAVVSLPIVAPDQTQRRLVAQAANEAADSGWHRDLMYVQCGKVRTNVPLDLPQVSEHDVGTLRSALCKQFTSHLQELSLSAIHTWLRNSFPRTQLGSRELLRQVGQADFTDVQVASIVDALVRATILVPTLARAKYVLSHAPLASAATSDDDLDAPLPVPRPYLFPAIGMVKHAVVPKLQSVLAASAPDAPPSLTPFTLRRHIVHVVMNAHKDVSERKAQEVAEWCIWIMRKRGWVETVSTVRLSGAAESQLFTRQSVADQVVARRDSRPPKKPGHIELLNGTEEGDS